MMKWSKIMILGMIVFGMLGVIPASAQSTCGSLSREDCAILQNAQQATTDLNSGGFKATVEFDLGLSFFPDMLKLQLLADGVYTRVPVTRDDVDDDYRPLYGLNADMTVFLDGEINELVQPTDNTLTTSFDLRYVDGIGYADLSKVSPLTNLSGGAWYSVDVVDFLSKLIRDGIFPPAYDTMSVLTMLFGTDYIGELALYGSLRRVDDIQTDTQQFAVFEVALSFGDYLDATPFLYNSIVVALETSIRDFAPNYTNTEIRRAAQFYAEWFRAVDIQVMQTVGLDDGYVHHTQFELIFAPESTTTLNPDPLGLALFGGIQLRILLDFRYTQFGNVPLIIQPEQSSPLRYEDIFGNGDNSLF